MDTTSRSSTSSAAPHDDLAELPLERLEAELCTWSANLAAAGRADALVAAAGAALAATDDQLATGRHRYLVHFHTGDDRQEAHPDGTDEEMAVGVSDATAERLCCDADEETVIHSQEGGEAIHVSKRSSTIRGRLRRLVQLRDRTCRVPGCGHAKRFTASTIVGAVEPTHFIISYWCAATTTTDSMRAAGRPNGSTTARSGSHSPTEWSSPPLPEPSPAIPKQ